MSDDTSSDADRIAILWLRQDLRLADNPALEAAQGCARILPIWIDEPATSTAIGAAGSVWTHHSLVALGDAFASLGVTLRVAQGEPMAVLGAVIDALVAHGTARKDVRLFWNRRYDPESIASDKALKNHFTVHKPRTFNAYLLHEPWEVLKKDGTPYRVFTPYWRVVAARLDAGASAAASAAASAGASAGASADSSSDALASDFDISPAPRSITGLEPSDELEQALAHAGIESDVDALGLLPSRPWHSAMMAHWSVGESAAMARLEQFVAQGAVHGYDEGRNLPGVDATSRLSPHLHHGELSPRQILHRVCAGRPVAALGDGELTFIKEIVWREFAAAMLYHFPHTVDEPLDRRFHRFEWSTEPEPDLAAWQQGRTGVPIVDAGMRQLYATGWMHNRVRMVVASYLIKNLLVDWREGEAWFRDTLVDADLASNVLGWQWAAGCGADAAPFFRIFNPVLQGGKFDKAGTYVRHWVPELASLEDRDLHKPWELPDAVREQLDYPAPLVDLKASRLRALDAFAKIKSN